MQIRVRSVGNNTSNGGTMPKIVVNGVTLVFEILGQGLPIVFTPGGFWGIDHGRPIARQLSSEYKVLIYDPRNCGASDVVISDSQSEVDLWAEDLHALLGNLGMSPAYVGGGSRGAVLSLILAHRHPEDVMGLFLIAPPSDDLEVWEWLANNRYVQPAKLAEIDGMKAVIETSTNWEADHTDWNWGKRIVNNPSNRDRLLSMNPKEFAVIIKRWATFMTSGRAHIGGLTDEMLHSISAPSIIIPGLDELHTQHAAEELHRLLPQSDLAVLSESLSPSEMDQLQKWVDQGEGELYDAACAPIIDAFICKI